MSFLEKRVWPFPSKRKVGETEEARALGYFEKRGWKLLRQNYRCRLGEIDLIFKDRGGCVVFVEVKFRSHAGFGAGQEAVGAKKRGRMSKTALFYIKQNGLEGSDFRFDVAALGPGKIEHIANAFSPEGYTL